MDFKDSKHLIKKTALTLLFGSLLTACAPTQYVQIVDIQSSSLPVEGGHFIYTDENFEISYDFWKNNGDPGFVIENLTNELLYINLAHSFFTRNGVAYDYFLNRSYGLGKTSTTASGSSASASVYGTWALLNLPGSKSFTKTEGTSFGSTSNLTYEEKEIAIVPPHSKKYFSEYYVLGDVIQDCTMKMFPKRKQKESIIFQEDNSPVTFGNYITYKIGENSEYSHLTNNFYISGFSNYKIEDVKEKIKVGCREQVKIEINKYQKGTSFFIYYDDKHNNDYSKDSKELPSQNAKFYDAMY